MKTIYSSKFRCELGIIISSLESDNFIHPNISKSGNIMTIETKAHIVELIELKLKNNWIPNGMSFENSNGWIWKIKKNKNIEETISINCNLIEPTDNLNSGYDTGEYLDALEIENGVKVLHIGTEDSECLYERAKKSNMMPNRLIKDIKGDPTLPFYFTEYLDFGFRTKIPKLFVGENIYFHYLVAINTIKPSSEYPEEQDDSTWFAVDQSKEFLDKELSNIRK